MIDERRRGGMIEERRSVGAAYDATFFVPLRDRVRILQEASGSREREAC
jgi:hypothetical protein